MNGHAVLITVLSLTLIVLAIAAPTGCKHLRMRQGPSLKWEGQNSGICVSHRGGTGFERQISLSEPK